MRGIAFLIATAILLPAAPANATQVTCEPGSEGVCEAWCDHAGGGMSSNPDGSTTCTVMAAQIEKALTTAMKPDIISKLRGYFDNVAIKVQKAPPQK